MNKRKPIFRLNKIDVIYRIGINTKMFLANFKISNYCKAQIGESQYRFEHEFLNCH